MAESLSNRRESKEWDTAESYRLKIEKRIAGCQQMTRYAINPYTLELANSKRQPLPSDNHFLEEIVKYAHEHGKPLGLDLHSTSISVEEMEALLELPELKGLQYLRLFGELSEDIVYCLCEADWPLKQVVFSHISEDRESWPYKLEALAHAPLLSQCTHCTLIGCPLGIKEMEIFANALDLPYLRSLTLRANGIDYEAACRLSEAKQMPHIERLDLGINPLGPDGIVPIVKSCPRLTHLRLGECALGAKGVANLASVSKCLSRLTQLDLNTNRIDDDGLSDFAQTADFPVLRQLNLSSNLLGPNAPGKLATSSLSTLEHLDLSHNLRLQGIGDSEVLAFFAGLQVLSIYCTRVSLAEIRALLGSSTSLNIWLSRPTHLCFEQARKKIVNMCYKTGRLSASQNQPATAEDMQTILTESGIYIS